MWLIGQKSKFCAVTLLRHQFDFRQKYRQCGHAPPRHFQRARADREIARRLNISYIPDNLDTKCNLAKPTRYLVLTFLVAYLPSGGGNLRGWNMCRNMLTLQDSDLYGKYQYPFSMRNLHKAVHSWFSYVTDHALIIWI